MNSYRVRHRQRPARNPGLWAVVQALLGCLLLFLLAGPGLAASPDPASSPPDRHYYLPLAVVNPGGRLGHGRLPPADQPLTYVLKPGDDLVDLALELGRDVQLMACVTPSAGFPLSELRPGQMITIPSSRYACHIVQPGETLDQIAERYRVNVSVIVETAWNELEGADAPLKPGQRLLIFGGQRPPQTTRRIIPQRSPVQRPAGLRPTAVVKKSAAPSTAAQGNRTPVPAEDDQPAAPADVAPGTTAAGQAQAPEANQLTSVPEAVATPEPAPADAASTPPNKPTPVPWPYGDGHFIWPVHGVVSQGYSDRHKALDIAADFGAPVVAADNGVVKKAGWSPTGYGLRVVVDHNIDYVTLYAHLSDIVVKEGQVVEKGQVIGYVGSTGNSTGPHVHFEIRDFGYLVDPLPLLEQ